MRKGLLLALTVLFAAAAAVLTLPYADGSAGAGVTITEVDPYNEGITVTNTGASDVDLNGWSLTDGEGTVLFTASRILRPGDSVTLVKAVKTDWFTSREGCIVYGESGTAKSRSLVLADSGDEVSLYHGSKLVDSVCYGNSKGADGWNGGPAEISSRKYLLRTGGDTDTAADWTATRPGWTNLSFSDTEMFEAQVTPFTFPESCGIPAVRALQNAGSSVDISIYLLTSPNVCALLCQLQEKGVRIRILLEGSPLGTDISDELSMMKSICDAGGEVRLINSESGNNRFTYLHNKYAVIDGSAVIITSENWTAGNMGGSGNRGWGAVIESAGYADYMEKVFENDFSYQWGDVRSLQDAYPGVKAASDLSFRDPGGYGVRTYACSVSPVLSPDDSFPAMKRLMSEVTSTLYAEQLDLSESLSRSEGDTPVAWMYQAAERGADVKFILDASESSGAQHENYVSMINATTSVHALAVNGRAGFATIHNKGIIMDSGVWLGSVNWTVNSFQNNRETAVFITSQDIADYFQGYFDSDYGTDISSAEKNGLSFSVAVREVGGRYVILMSALQLEGYRYVWHLGNDTVRTTSVSKAVFGSPGPGTYVASVEIEGTGISESYEYTVPGSSSGTDAYLIYGVAVSVFLIGTGAALARRRRCPYRELMCAGCAAGTATLRIFCSGVRWMSISPARS